MTQARVDGSDRLGPAGFTLKDMQNMVFSDRQYAGELWRDALVALCRGLSGGLAPTSSGGPVAVGDACDVLANWDLHENLNSSGAVLFRRFVDHAMSDQASPFSQPFDASDPVHTPSGLNTSDPEVSVALGDAIQDLKNADIPLNASPRQEQYVPTGDQLPFDNAPPTAPVGGARIPIHGGVGDPNGEFNAIYAVHHRQGIRPGLLRLVVRSGDHLEQRPVPSRGDDPDLLAVGQHRLAAPQRPDPAVLQPPVGYRPVLPRRGPQGHEVDDHAPG
jgi:acyl-homoserine-lactone acylase